MKKLLGMRFADFRFQGLPARGRMIQQDKQISRCVPLIKINILQWKEN
jgi:hypothetical protein